MTIYTAPFGFQPAKRVADRVNNNAQQEFPIQSGYAVALRPGDLVRLNAAGYVAKETGTATYLLNGGGILGVFLGCNYTDPVLGHTYRQNWTAGTVAADAVAMIDCDPGVVMRVAYVSAGTTVTGLTRPNAIGKNVAIVQNATSTTTSDIAVTGAATTATLPLKIYDVDLASLNPTTGLYTAMFVIYNAANHAFTSGVPATV